MKNIPLKKKNFCIIISGPTCTGKSDFALQLAEHFPIEIINADIGSLYTPLTIGTAKPNWKKELTPHHFFDKFDDPVDWTAPQFRSQLTTLIDQIIHRGNIPVIVGGSAFYVQSFFYKNKDIAEPDLKIVRKLEEKTSQELWDELYAIDSDRAEKIGRTDHYRLVRALSIWYTCQEKPSLFIPLFKPLCNFYYINLFRDKDELYTMIDKRVIDMMNGGWLDEVRSLSCDERWSNFLFKKKMMGYDLLLEYIQGNYSEYSFDDIISIIQQRTRNYAKRQVTFLKKLIKNITEQIQDESLDKVVSYTITNQSLIDTLKTVCRDINRILEN